MKNVKFDRKVVDNAVAAAHVVLSDSRVRNDIKGDVRVVKFTKTSATDEQVASIKDSLSRTGNEFAYEVAVVKGNLTVTVSVAPKEAPVEKVPAEGKPTMAKDVRAIIKANPQLWDDKPALCALVAEQVKDLPAKLVRRYVNGNLKVVKAAAEA